ncbi:DUF4352 domain-containing protein [Streptomyces sp. NPDC058614]|uniref:DUF4352 domain-containing protein n=1 Tax=Streptomyces sp. NPDC058614 TaxID=3346557 RepID=UPI00366405B5
MSQQYPQQPQQPGWGAPQQPGYGAPNHPQQPPGWGAPPPQPPKKSPAGKIIGFGCLGIVALFLLIGIIGAIANGSDDPDTTSKDSATVTADDNPKAKDTEPAVEAETEAPAEPPVKITATNTDFAPSILAEGTAYTSVKVTMKNNSDETINVNVLYFEITDTNGTKHSAELAVDENQIDTVDLAPGENVSGSITGKGKFTPKTVTYTDFLSDPVRAAVS